MTVSLTLREVIATFGPPDLAVARSQAGLGRAATPPYLDENVLLGRAGFSRNTRKSPRCSSPRGILSLFAIDPRPQSGKLVILYCFSREILGRSPPTMRPLSLETREKSPRCSSCRRLLSLFARSSRPRVTLEVGSGVFGNRIHSDDTTAVVSADDEAAFSRNTRDVTAVLIVSSPSLAFREKFPTAGGARGGERRLR
jgi:hypothetical protein